jgi:putative transcriptional regulator
MAATMARESQPVLINRFSRLCGERRVSVQDVARGTGLSYRGLHDLYHGRTTRVELDTLNRLCAFFDVTPAEIFEWRRTADDPAPTTAKGE